MAREDFYQLMSDVIGELNASHLGVGGATAFARPRPSGQASGPRPGGMGYLGAWFDEDYDGPGLKEVGRDHPDYGRFLVWAEDGEDPRDFDK